MHFCCFLRFRACLLFLIDIVFCCIESSFDDVQIYAVHIVLCCAYRFMSCTSFYVLHCFCFLCFSMFIVFGWHGFLFCVESSFNDVLIYAVHVVLCRAYRFMSCIAFVYGLFKFRAFFRFTPNGSSFYAMYSFTVVCGGSILVFSVFCVLVFGGELNSSYAAQHEFALYIFIYIIDYLYII